MINRLYKCCGLKQVYQFRIKWKIELLVSQSYEQSYDIVYTTTMQHGIYVSWQPGPRSQICGALLQETYNQKLSSHSPDMFSLEIINFHKTNNMNITYRVATQMMANHPSTEPCSLHPCPCIGCLRIYLSFGPRASQSIYHISPRWCATASVRRSRLRRTYSSRR